MNFAIWVVQLGHHSVCTKRCSTYSRHSYDYTVALAINVNTNYSVDEMTSFKWLARSGGTWGVKYFSKYTIPPISLNIIKSEVWTIIHCLGLGHETMVCAVCLFIFLNITSVLYLSCGLISIIIYNHIYIHHLLLGPWPLSFKTHHACY